MHTAEIIERKPLYFAADWKYIRFTCGCMEYEINRDYNWRSYPVYKQVARIGNSVVPIMAEKLVEANCPYLKVSERVANLRVTEENSNGQLKFRKHNTRYVEIDILRDGI